MSTSITTVPGSIDPGSIASIQREIQPRSTEKPELGNAFANALTEARNNEHSSTDMAERFAHGDPNVGIHEVMIASEKANISLRYATTLKNKAVEAYKELMATQV
jgi:flagellar hook-basal body complex protein FliE